MIHSKLKHLTNTPIRFIQFIKLRHAICLLLFTSGSLLCHTLNAQEFTHPLLFSFEESVSPLVPGKHSVLKTTGEHYKHGMHSVAWKWKKANSQIYIKQPIGYLINNPDPKEWSVSTFIFWVYSKKALPVQKLRFEFLKNGKVCSWCDYGMNFTGWRGAWIAFDRDMQGKPEEGMDELRITAPDVANGELLFDHIILSSFQDVRQHTADFQAPYIQKEVTNHFVIVYKHWMKQFDLPIANNVSDTELSGIKATEANLTKLLLSEKGTPIEQLRKSFNSYNIVTNSDGSLTGKPIFFCRFVETYFSMGSERSLWIYHNIGQGLSQASILLLNMAREYHQTNNLAEKEEIANMFIMLTRHLTDQGIAAGSAMGTLHHIGYGIQNYYPAMFLMKDILVKEGLDKETQQSMEWFSGTGEVKTAPEIPGVDSDALKTSLIGRISSILMMRDTPEKVTYLKSFTRWINNGLSEAEGLSPTMKSDGTMHHHRNHYPMYAVGGLKGAVAAVSILANTPFAISQESHEVLKHTLLSFRFFCNIIDWPISLSGHRPTGKRTLIPSTFAKLALTGSPDGKQAIDKDLASAYMRLTQGQDDEFNKLFRSNGISPEHPPVGNRTFPYTCMSIHRRDDWMVSIKGFSRYIWGSEIYDSLNIYGRYLNFGNMQILASGDPISNSGSGFSQEGWDWNHWWGTTVMVLPLEKLKSNVLNVDTISGIEEMLLSDETYAGSVSLANEQGVFAMKLHDHDKYNGKLRANKSWFMFDNRIVALGSDICNESTEYPVETTLFQEAISPLSDNTILNKRVISAFPFSEIINGKSVIGDAQGNLYLVKDGKIRLERKENSSIDHTSSKETKGNFASAVLSHGFAPHDAKYEYLVLVQPTTEEINTITTTESYSVLRCDSKAHIVSDKFSKTTGYAFFEAGNSNIKSDVLNVSLPCMLMTRTEGDKLRLSACDPDLRFYEGEADEKFDAEGKRIERSIYARTWTDTPSKESKLQVEISGQWSIVSNNPYAQIIKSTNTTTTIEFTCREGKTREILLIK
jgi:chondroitin-sulfate-ABC endolyase/exolyase